LTLNLTSRRHAAGRFHLLATATLSLGLLLPGSTSIAQHGGGGRPMASGGMMEGRNGNMNSGRFNRSESGPRLQPRMGLQLGLGGRWWDDHHTVHKLNLNSDQQHRMDNIFETNKPTLVNLYANLQREELNLASLSSADLKDESKVFAAIDRVSHASSDLEKENAHMLLQIRQLLDPEQLQVLDHEIASVR
jgi:Spy/CpxP family protein refolding chaperone